MAGAVEAIVTHLNSASDSTLCPPRMNLSTATGSMLLMPAIGTSFAGAKIVTVNPDNSAGVPRVQGLYVLFNGSTLSPIAIIDGIALTALRTPAVSAAAMQYLAAPESERLVVYGSGTQAWGHVLAAASVRPIAHVAVAARNSDRAGQFVDRIRTLGLSASLVAPSDVAQADIIACCTTSNSPLFDGQVPKDNCMVIAIGSHEPDARETDDALASRSTVVVESVDTALSEAGDIIQAIAKGAIGPDSLITLEDVADPGRDISMDRPRLFKSTGMAWQDLCVASALYSRWKLHRS